jgi:uncharacterized membrane protein YkvA (DUF1232 family)
MRRLLQFRNELVALWHAFFAPETPIYLKALMLLVPAYLLSPLDLIPDVIPIAGWLDDAIVIPLLVSWIVSMLPQKRPQPAYARAEDRYDGPVIDGDYRRL